MEIWADYVHGVKEKLQAGMGSGLPGNTRSIRKQPSIKNKKWQGMRKCKVQKREKGSERKRVSQNDRASGVRSRLVVFQRELT